MKQLQCLNCGTIMPYSYEYCLACGAKVDRSGPFVIGRDTTDRHFSLEDIARQSESMLNQGVGDEAEPADDTLPPIGSRERADLSQLRIPMGEDPTPVSSPFGDLESAPASEGVHGTTNLPEIGHRDKVAFNGGQPVAVTMGAPVFPAESPQNNGYNPYTIPMPGNGTNGYNGPASRNIPSRYNHPAARNAAYGYNVPVPQQGVPTQNIPARNTPVSQESPTGNIPALQESPAGNTPVPQSDPAVNDPAYGYNNPAAQNPAYGYNNPAVNGTGERKRRTAPEPTANSVNDPNFSPYAAITATDSHTEAVQMALASQRDKRTAAMVIGVLIGLILILVIIFTSFLLSDHGVFDNPTKASETSMDMSSVSAEDVVLNNMVNSGIAACDDEGNSYYQNSSGILWKRDASGSITKLYNANESDYFIHDICFYDGRLYFLSKFGTSYRLCSVSPDGTNMKSIPTAESPDSIVFSGDTLYYVSTVYSEKENDDSFVCKIHKCSITGDDDEELLTYKNEYIRNLFMTKDKLYFLHFRSDSSNGEAAVLNPDDGSVVDQIIATDNNAVLKCYYMTCSGGRIYIVSTVGGKYNIYSMTTGFTDVKRVGKATNVVDMIVYGNYIYYTNSKTYKTRSTLYVNNYTRNSSGQSTYSHPLRRMKIDGTEDVLVVGDTVCYYAIAGDKLYYVNGGYQFYKADLNGTNTEYVI